MCVFCSIVDHTIPSKVVYEDDNVLAILDINPLSKGHTVVMPKKHVTSLLEADEETTSRVMHVVHKLSNQVVTNLNADGCNILSNCKEAAGQSVDHMHIHIIPRYNGDNTIELHPTSEKVDLDAVLETIKK